jgi:hypothetical protein
LWCKGTSYCCAKKSSLNLTKKTRWDADGPNGPNTEPNSMSVLLLWWTNEGNYTKNRGGKDQIEKTKKAFWQLLSQAIKENGILVE